MSVIPKMSKRGYVRVDPNPSKDAVLWWYCREFSDGFIYARGGAVATAREARRLIRECDEASLVVHASISLRPEGVMDSDGNVTPISYASSGMRE